MITPIKLITSGGQTGADEGALLAAEGVGIPTGGFMPMGWRTERGPRPEYATRFGLEEWVTSDYPNRTKQNVVRTDATIIFGRRSPGSNSTEEYCRVLGKPCMWVFGRNGIFELTSINIVRLWIVRNNIHYLNVAGNRESVNPGIRGWVESFMIKVLEER